MNDITLTPSFNSLTKITQYMDLSLSLSPPILEQQPQQEDPWTNNQKKRFKRALSEFSFDTPNFFQKVAKKVPKKSVEQVKKFFEASYRLEGNVYVLVNDFENDISLSPTGPTKNIPDSGNNPPYWTQNEHKNFLLGVEKYGRGMWKQIAENCIPSKTARQISNHARDFFNEIEKSHDPSTESSKNTDGSTITAAAIAATKNHLEASSSKGIKVVEDDLRPRKVQRTLNLLPLVAADYASSSQNQEAEECQEQEGGDDCTMNLFPTQPVHI